MSPQMGLQVIHHSNGNATLAAKWLYVLYICCGHLRHMHTCHYVAHAVTVCSFLQEKKQPSNEGGRSLIWFSKIVWNGIFEIVTVARSISSLQTSQSNLKFKILEMTRFKNRSYINWHVVLQSHKVPPEQNLFQGELLCDGRQGDQSLVCSYPTSWN